MQVTGCGGVSNLFGFKIDLLTLVSFHSLYIGIVSERLLANLKCDNFVEALKVAQ